MLVRLVRRLVPSPSDLPTFSHCARQSWTVAVERSSETNGSIRVLKQQDVRQKFFRGAPKGGATAGREPASGGPPGGRFLNRFHVPGLGFVLLAVPIWCLGPAEIMFLPASGRDAGARFPEIVLVKPATSLIMSANPRATTAPVPCPRATAQKI